MKKKEAEACTKKLKLAKKAAIIETKTAFTRGKLNRVQKSLN